VELDAALAQLETLVQTLEAEGDERSLLLLQLVDAIHRPGLARIAAGEVDHPLVHALLGMYGLEPLEPELLAEEALDEVRPYIESHGGEVELLGVEDGVVRVRLAGACVGCAGSAMTLRRGVEEALREHFPDFRELVAEEAAPEEPPPLGIALPMAPEIRPTRPVFVDVAADGELPDGEMRAVEAAGASVLLVRVAGEVYALRNGCSVDGLPLEGGRLTPDGVIVCPWHNCAFDVRSGRRVDDEEGRLGVLPVALRDGAVKVAVDVA
jgi:Fe-S cluster biogenesis protein NfuA/nitrite reductase/ring-hydroxylating ferredoxin subunit